MKASRFKSFCTIGSRLTLAQDAYTAVAYDGMQPADLVAELREKAAQIFGGLIEIPLACRRVVAMNKGREVGGTRLASEQAARLGLTLPITRADPSELVYVFFGGPKARHGRVGLRFARNACKRHGATFLDDSADGFTIVRHDGRRVRFEVFAASRGGDNTRGVPIVCAVLTEAAFYYDEATGVSNGEQIFAAIIPRLLPGGQIIIESTPWAEEIGLHAREFSRNFGNPTTALAANCPTLLMRDDPETKMMVAQEYERDGDNADRELGAHFMPVGSGKYMDGFAVTKCADDTMPLVLPVDHAGWTVSAGYDPAYSRDSAAGVVIRTKGGLFEVVEVFERTPKKGSPLVPSVTDKEFAAVAVRHGAKRFASDVHYKEAVKEHIANTGLKFVDAPGNNSGKVEVFGAAREVIHSGRARWSAGHRRLTQQVRDVISKPLSAGLVAISSPRRRGAHGDIASALCLAIWAADRPIHTYGNAPAWFVGGPAADDDDDPIISQLLASI